MHCAIRLLFVLLTPFLLPTFADVAAAEPWTPITCPEVPQALANQFETVRTLSDFNNEAKGWKSILGGQQAKSNTSTEADAGRHRSNALRVDYEFVGKEGLEYVAFGSGDTIDEPGHSLGFWYRFGAQPLTLRMRITDRSGETHQLDLPRPEGEGWNFTAVPLKPQGSKWGGDGNGRLDYPVRLDSIVADRPKRGYVGEGSLWIDDVALMRPIKQTHKLAIEIENARLGNVYLPGEKVKLRVAGDGDEIRWNAKDYFGRTVVEGDSADKQATIEFPLDTIGYHECRIDLVRDGRNADSRQFSCAAFPNPRDVKNAFVGMGCHFRRNAYSLECMDLLVRYGFSEFRDEISWSGVERTKGQYEIPEYGAEYVARAKALGLSPLLIFDYSNALYDNAGFPNSDEAIAAYAKYCAFLTRELRDSVHDFEIWNEWSIGCGMRDKPGKNTPEAYARLIQPAFKAIKAANPEATVVGLGGEHSEHHFEQIRGMLESGAAGSMDASSVHCYRYPRTPEESDLVGEIVKVTDMVVANGGPGNAWITEIGWPTHTDARGVDERTQARMFVRTLALMRGLKCVEKVHWYDFKDDGLNRNYNENNFGLVHHQNYALAPKPGVVAAAVFARMTAGAKPLRLWHRDQTHAAILQCPDDEQLAIAWNVEGKSQMPLPKNTMAHDLMGNQTESKSQIELSQDPVYVKSQDLARLFPANGN